MTCRHRKFRTISLDPGCSSYEEPKKVIKELSKQLLPGGEDPTTPDSKNYEILEVAKVGTCMVLKVKYPNCSKCAYEGTKVLVYQNVTDLDVYNWRTIDPHFADLTLKRKKTEAPAPIARFPASELGWKRALMFANMLME